MFIFLDMKIPTTRMVQIIEYMLRSLYGAVFIVLCIYIIIGPTWYVFDGALGGYLKYMANMYRVYIHSVFYFPGYYG